MQAPPNPKLEELRARLKADPKNRIFYPLAEELRKVGQFAEAEQVLRTGLEHHATYLSAWVSLGRVLHESGKDPEAIDALTRALQLDGGNVVTARLLGDCYLAVGEKVEAIKKYKLVHALLPGDEELVGTIARLDRELNQSMAPVALSPAEEEPGLLEQSLEGVQSETVPPAVESLEWADETAPPFELSDPSPTGDEIPMLATHDDSPFEEPLQTAYTAAAVEVEAPAGVQVVDAPLAAEVPLPWDSEPAPPVYSDDEEVEEEEAAPAEPPAINTITMADLYTKQGLIDQARRIYNNILEKEPDNEDVRQRLAALDAGSASRAQAPAAERKIARLQAWVDTISRNEASRV